MQSQGMYTSLKPETFNQQNELTPQAMFVSHLNIQQKRTIFEQTINDNNRWVDALSIYDNIINVTEWKNLQLDFLEIEACDNNPNLVYRREACIHKVSKLRSMTLEEVLKLKVTHFDQLKRNGQTMVYILNNGFHQACQYAIPIQNNHLSSVVYVHCAFSIGTSWIVYKSGIVNNLTKCIKVLESSMGQETGETDVLNFPGWIINNE